MAMHKLTNTCKIDLPNDQFDFYVSTFNGKIDAVGGAQIKFLYLN